MKDKQTLCFVITGCLLIGFCFSRVDFIVTRWRFWHRKLGEGFGRQKRASDRVPQQLGPITHQGFGSATLRRWWPEKEETGLSGMRETSNKNEMLRKAKIAVGGQNSIGIYIIPLASIQYTAQKQNIVCDNQLLKLQPVVTNKMLYSTMGC